jgi:hypothetical protein
VVGRLPAELVTPGLAGRAGGIVAEAVARRIIDAPLEALGEHMGEALGDVATHVGADLAAIMVRSADGMWLEHRHVWARAGAPKMRPPQRLRLANLPWFAANLDDLDRVLVVHPGDLPEQAELARGMLAGLGVTACACVPFDRLETPRASSSSAGRTQRAMPTPSARHA